MLPSSQTSKVLAVSRKDFISEDVRILNGPGASILDDSLDATSRPEDIYSEQEELESFKSIYIKTIPSHISSTMAGPSDDISTMTQRIVALDDLLAKLTTISCREGLASRELRNLADRFHKLYSLLKKGGSAN
jgi:hypothetical protein